MWEIKFWKDEKTNDEEEINVGLKLGKQSFSILFNEIDKRLLRKLLSKNVIVYVLDVREVAEVLRINGESKMNNIFSSYYQLLSYPPILRRRMEAEFLENANIDLNVIDLNPDLVEVLDKIEKYFFKVYQKYLLFYILNVPYQINKIKDVKKHVEWKKEEIKKVGNIKRNVIKISTEI